MLPAEIFALAGEIAEAGGRLLIVGGWVRDALRGQACADLDLEVHGLDTGRVTALLAPHGFTGPVGRQFSVWRHNGLSLDVATPHHPPGAEATSLSDRSLEAALRGRDLTVNAMAWDPLSRQLLDPLGGATDLAEGWLWPADPHRFGEDPLRVLRAARLSALLDAKFAPELPRLARQLDLSGLPVERLAGELRRMLFVPERPWRCLEALRALGRLDVFPPVAALEGVPQDPRWHPEGDVFVHTGMVVDAVNGVAEGLAAGQREALLWAALCHDLGKPATTEVGPGGIVRSIGHETRGETITRAWLGSLRLAGALIESVALLVRHHLAPSLLVAQESGPKAYRRLARKLSLAGLHLTDLERLARADHLGRTTPDARAGRYEAGDAFLKQARAARVHSGVRPDVVRAADWMRSGVPAGPLLGRLLAQSRAVQDETGWEDPGRIMERVRKIGPPGGGPDEA
jgi:tRNA nucleotidyltransferase (CCA-adding enzyme)